MPIAKYKLIHKDKDRVQDHDHKEIINLLFFIFFFLRGKKIFSDQAVVIRLVPPDLADPTAESDSITNGEHTKLNPRVSSECLVELENEVPIVPNVLPERRVGWGHHRAVPQSVVVADYAPNLNQVNQPLVVIYVVVLVGVNEDKVKAPMVIPLWFIAPNHKPINQSFAVFNIRKVSN